MIQEIIPNQKLEHTWMHPSHRKGVCMLSWELQPLGDAMNVKLTHRGIENFEDAGEGFARKVMKSAGKK